MGKRSWSNLPPRNLPVLRTYKKLLTRAYAHWSAPVTVGLSARLGGFVRYAPTPRLKTAFNAPRFARLLFASPTFSLCSSRLASSALIFASLSLIPPRCPPAEPSGFRVLPLRLSLGFAGVFGSSSFFLNLEPARAVAVAAASCLLPVRSRIAL